MSHFKIVFTLICLLYFWTKFLIYFEKISTKMIYWRDCKGKMKGARSWKLITLGLDRDPWKLYLMFLSWEIDIKLCQIYTKIWNLNHMTRTPTNGSAVYWSRVSVCITWPVYCTLINFHINLTQFYINFSRQEHHI